MIRIQLNRINKLMFVSMFLLSLFALSGHFATAEAQSGSWRLKEIKVFFPQKSGYSTITSEKYDKRGGYVEINIDGKAFGSCPGGSEKLFFKWSFEGDIATVSNGAAVTANLQAGVAALGGTCNGALANHSALSIVGSKGGSSPLSAAENRLVEGDRFVNKDDRYYVGAGEGRRTSNSSVGVSTARNFKEYPLGYFEITIGTRPGDFIRYVYIYESVGSGGGNSGATNPASGRWSGSWDNSKGEGGNTTINIIEGANGVITGDEDGWTIENGRRSGNALTWEYRNKNNGCRDYKVRFEISADGGFVNGGYEVSDSCEKLTYTGKYINYRKQ